MFNRLEPSVSYDRRLSPIPAALEFSCGEGIFFLTSMSYPNTAMNMSITPSSNFLPYFGLSTDYLVDSHAVHIAV